MNLPRFPSFSLPNPSWYQLFFDKSHLLIKIKKRLWLRCFPVNFGKFLRITFFTEPLWATASASSQEFEINNLAKQLSLREWMETASEDEFEWKRSVYGNEIKVVQNITSAFTPKTLFKNNAPWKHKFRLLSASCSYICKIAISRDVTPIIYPDIFYFLVFIPHLPLFASTLYPTQTNFGTWPTSKLWYVKHNRKRFLTDTIKRDNSKHDISSSLGNVNFLLGTISDFAVTKFVSIITSSQDRT